MSKIFIQSLGAEIEGAWNDLPKEFFVNSHVYRNDGSLNNMYENVCINCHYNKRKHIQGDTSCNNFIKTDHYNEDDTDNKQYFNFVGEIASNPFFKLANLANWIRKYYPTYFNDSCSIHLHFKPINDSIYNVLMNHKFYKFLYNSLEYFIESRSIEKNHLFVKRVKGLTVNRNGTNYCKKGFMPFDKSNNSDNDRYHGINYCKNKHGTIEIRLGVPFKDPEITVDYIKFVFDCMNNYVIRNYTPIRLSKEIVL